MRRYVVVFPLFEILKSLPTQTTHVTSFFNLMIEQQHWYIATHYKLVYGIAYRRRKITTTTAVTKIVERIKRVRSINTDGLWLHVLCTFWLIFPNFSSFSLHISFSMFDILHPKSNKKKKQYNNFMIINSVAHIL